MTELAQKCMLVKLTIRGWSGRKFDRKVTEKTIADYGADKDAGRFNKLLIDKDAIKKVEKSANALRSFFYDNTLPWSDSGQSGKLNGKTTAEQMHEEKSSRIKTAGWRILLNINRVDFDRGYRQLRDEHEANYIWLCDNFESLKQKAAYDLNGMFNPADYPTSRDLRERFVCEFDEQTLPIIPDDFRTTIQAEEVEKIRAKAAQKVTDNIQMAMEDLWRKLYDILKHMHSKLADADAVFRNTLITNVCDIASMIPKLNLTEDPKLDEIARNIRDDFCNFDQPVNLDNLRQNKSYRLNVAGSAKAHLEVMEQYMTSS